MTTVIGDHKETTPATGSKSKSHPARLCKIGDKVKTDFSGKITYHTIVNRCTDRTHGLSQSGILFKLSPLVPKSGGGWIDADWFHPA